MLGTPHDLPQVISLSLSEQTVTENTWWVVGGELAQENQRDSNT